MWQSWVEMKIIQVPYAELSFRVGLIVLHRLIGYSHIYETHP